MFDQSNRSLYITSIMIGSFQGKSSGFDQSLEDAVRLATELKKLSGKMKSSVKEDLRKSVRNEHVWTTAATVT